MTAALFLLVLGQASPFVGATDTNALELQRGGTIEVSRSTKAKRAVDGPLTARVFDIRGEGAVSVLPGARVSQSGRTINVALALRARRLAEVPSTLKAKIEVSDGRGVVKTFSFVAKVTTLPTVISKDSLQPAVLAYQAAQKQATAAHRKLKKLRSYVRLDRFDPPPPRNRIEAGVFEILAVFRQHRLQADSARTYLLAAAKVGDFRKEAVMALGRLEKGPQGAQTEARALDELNSKSAVALARRTLEQLHLEAAEGMLNKLRNGGRLEQGQLADVLGYLAVVDVVRDRQARAQRLAGQARCLAPKSEINLRQPGLQAIAKEVSAPADACPELVKIRSLSARRVEATEGSELEVTVEYGPDPFALVSGVRVELWGYGGAMFKAVRGSAPKGGQSITVSMDEPKEASNFANRILVKAALLEVSGVELALLGDPDPASVELSGVEKPKEPLPWWVWALAGSAAVVGGGVALGVWAANRDPFPQRGVGPVNVSF